MIVSNPRMAQVNCLFASSTLSLLPPYITMLKAPSPIVRTASGAATYSNAPARICSIKIRPVEPPSPSSYRFLLSMSLKSKGALSGRKSVGMLYAASAICARSTPLAAAISIIDTIFSIFLVSWGVK